jgi:diguanylate cyclase (GGDEF)-like protein/PAS domain S-box-containing protein
LQPTNDETHPLLLRQLRRLGLNASDAPAGPEAWRRLLARVRNAYREADQDRYLLERSQEISSRELVERAQALQLNQARLASLLSLSSDWVWETDQRGRFVYVSEGWSQATDQPAAAALGRRLGQVPGLELGREQSLALRRAFVQRRAFRELTVAIRRPDAERRYLRVSGAPMHDAAGRFTGFRGVGSDVTAATLAALQADHMARFDSLTGLPNRAQLKTVLKRALVGAAAGRTRVAAVFIDLDGFKYINDNLGHAAGDELLCEMARRLADVVRSGDLVARLGGDEFVVVIENAGDGPVLAALAHRILVLLSQPVPLEGRWFELTGSIGISVYPDDAHDAETLLRHADTAMYVAKEQGKNSHHFYTAELAARAAEQFALETELRGALERDELELHYQPKVALAHGMLTGVEALVRWRHPRRGLVMPGEFVPLAERRGLISPLGRWVMGAACRQMARWRDDGVVVPQCAVNISAQHFTADTLVDDVQVALAGAGLPAGALEIEITESTVMRDPQRAQQVLGQLAALGVRIAIDDFGTGYSSLNYLKRFPAHALKIDRSFVRGLPGDSNDAAITRAVVAMAHSLGMKVVAEGVEQAQQLVFLSELGCDEAQGYLLGRPVPAEHLVATGGYLARAA